ncbi:hypothetical protein bcgnr5372_41150 [Bacillus luti]|nr:hypothetical protein [Bacillus cereus]HDR8327640.1 hypothetical protein [Bacillus cereus]HDR8334349.1 hypothetical protein [Bacillus cereus]
MNTIEDVLQSIKFDYEQTIQTAQFNGEQKPNGLEAKKCLVRSMRLINHLHEYIKLELCKKGVPAKNIAPERGEMKGELKLTGFLKHKRQDICVKPIGLSPQRELITDGPLSFQNTYDRYGSDFSEKILTINVRSQLSSTSKNFDTLMERTFAESCNLHTRYPKMVLGEVYLILAHEYDEQSMKCNQVRFKEKQKYIEKYISLFHSLNNRIDENENALNYERCALLIVDMRDKRPILFRNNNELVENGLISPEFPIPIESLSIESFIDDLFKVYDNRFGLNYLLKQEV